jgi:hypothetical protein
MAIDLKGKLMADPIPTAPVTSGVHPKVFLTGIAGAVTAILLWALSTFAHGVSVPPEVAAGLTTIIGAVVGYLAPAQS